MIIIIGAGITGLSVAGALKKSWMILEKESYWGGLCTQYKTGNHWFDFSGHYFHFKGKDKIKKKLDRHAPFIQYKKRSKTLVCNRMVPFPLQFHLSYLPRSLGRQILNEILSGSRHSAGSLSDFLKANFGHSLFKLFFEPFLTKYLQRDLESIIANMDKGSIPVPDKEQVLQGFSGKRFDDTGYNPVFYYPAIPMRRFIDNMAEKTKPGIHLNEPVVKIDTNARRVFTPNRSYPYDTIINTMPLKNLVQLLEPGDQLPPHQSFDHISTSFTNVVLRKKKRRFHWLYIPDPDIPFYRVGFYPGQSPPVCYLERTLKPGENSQRSLPTETAAQILKRLDVIDQPDDIMFQDTRTIPVSYVIFNHQWPNTVPATLKQLKRWGIHSIGRYGAWTYSSMSDDVRSALETAELMNRNHPV